MVELQIVVLAVAGSSPVGHPPMGRERSSTTRALAHFREATFVELAARRDNPVGHHLFLPNSSRDRMNTGSARDSRERARLHVLPKLAESLSPVVTAT
jgi:hypothetical protein